MEAIEAAEAALSTGRCIQRLIFGSGAGWAGVSRASSLCAGMVVVAGVAALSVTLANAATTMYKWTDENGVVHYTDKLPPDMVNRGNAELNKQGVTLRKTEPVPIPPEQRKAHDAEEQHKREVAKDQAETLRRDQALLSTPIPPKATSSSPAIGR